MTELTVLASQPRFEAPLQFGLSSTDLSTDSADVLLHRLADVAEAEHEDIILGCSERLGEGV
jgi:hypothetical protein